MSRVDKQYKSTLVLVILFAVALGAYFGYQKYGPKDGATKEEDKTAKINIITSKKEDINEVEIKNSNSDLILVKNNGKFELKDKLSIDLDQVVITNLVDTLSNLTATKEIGDITNMSDFGLGVPFTSLSFKVAGVPGKTIDIGDKVKERGYYMKVAGTTKVYIIDKASSDNLVLDLEAMRNKQVLNLKKEDINFLGLNKLKETTFEVAADNAMGGVWTVKKPFNIKGDDVKINEMANAITGMKVKEFIEVGKKNLAEYGLETPATTLKVGVKGSEPTRIFFGSEKEGQGRYVMKEGSNEILLLEPVEIAFTGFTFKEVSDKGIGGIVPTEVTSIEATMGADKVTLGITHGKEPGVDEIVTVNTVELKDKKSYQEFINAYSALSAWDIKPNEVVSKEAALEISANNKNGTVKTGFAKKSDDEYYVLKNGKYSGQIIKKEAFDTVAKALEQLKAAK